MHVACRCPIACGVWRGHGVLESELKHQTHEVSLVRRNEDIKVLFCSQLTDRGHPTWSIHLNPTYSELVITFCYNPHFTGKNTEAPGDDAT